MAIQPSQRSASPGSEVLGDRLRGQSLPSFAWNIHFRDQIPSTMDIVRWCRASDIAAQPGVVLYAGEQTAGVGQHGKWQSSAEDIKLNVLLPAANSKEEFGLFNCAAALSVVDTLREFSGDEGLADFTKPQFCVKLLNDVLTVKGANYHKIAGTLGVGKFDPQLRDSLSAQHGFLFPDDLTVIGIGVNLRSLEREVKDPRIPPIAFQDITGQVLARDHAVAALLRHLALNIETIGSSPEAFCARLSSLVACSAGSLAWLVLKTDGSNDGQIVKYKRVTWDGLEIETTSGFQQTVPLVNIQRLIPIELQIKA